MTTEPLERIRTRFMT